MNEVFANTWPPDWDTAKYTTHFFPHDQLASEMMIELQGPEELMHNNAIHGYR